MRVTILVAVVLVGSTSTPLSSQSPGVEELMKRAGSYVQRFVETFSNVVIEEDYLLRFASGGRQRTLKSDFLLVGYPGNTAFVMTFRDIREVDGKPLTDKEERITQLFLQPFDSAVKRAQEIHREGLRYALPPGRLTDPLAVLVYLQPSYQRQFRFNRGGIDRKLGPDVREVSFSLLGAFGRNVVQGRVWIAESSGEVVKTELREVSGARVTTTFAPEATLKLRVPVELRDVVPLGSNEFIGTATYANVRRFEVRTQSAVGAPPANPR